MTTHYEHEEQEHEDGLFDEEEDVAYECMVCKNTQAIFNGGHCTSCGCYALEETYL